MGSAHPFSVSFAPCFQGILCRSRLFFRMFLEKLFQICADRFITKQKRRCFSPFLRSPSSRRAWIEIESGDFILSKEDVALLAEGVDRNFGTKTHSLRYGPSPSSRRAWIEIRTVLRGYSSRPVALLAEGVDRNTLMERLSEESDPSPSSRRAWIEIASGRSCGCTPCVALLAEGVDRNIRYGIVAVFVGSRPPRGGRG